MKFCGNDNQSRSLLLRNESPYLFPLNISLRGRKAWRLSTMQIIIMKVTFQHAEDCWLFHVGFNVFFDEGRRD